MKTEITKKEQIEELKRSLDLLPMSKRKEVLEKGMEIARLRRKVAALKQEREQLLKNQG